MVTTTALNGAPGQPQGKRFRVDFTEKKRVVDFRIDWRSEGGVTTVESYELVSEETRKRGGPFGSYLCPARYRAVFTVDFTDLIESQPLEPSWALCGVWAPA